MSEFEVQLVTEKDFPIICRTCSIDENILPISETLIANVPVEELLRFGVGLIYRKDDSLPQNICQNCLTNLHKICSFKKLCQDNVKQLKTLLEDSEAVESGKGIYNNGEVITLDDQFLESNENEDNHVETSEDPVELCSDVPILGSSQSSDNISIEVPEATNEERKPEEKAPKPTLACPICAKVVVSSKISHHVATHYTVKTLSCDKCPKKFKRQVHLNRHKLAHGTKKIPKQRKGIICGVCSVRVPQFLLTEHMASHSGETPFLCEICPKKFGTKIALSRHKVRHAVTKGPEKKILCSVCGKAVGRSKLKEHILSHTGEKPYLCDKCPRRFAVKTNLTRHQILHSSNFPYLCGICGKKFRRPKGLKRHEKMHEKDTGKDVDQSRQTYNCEFCGRMFTSEHIYKFHLSKHSDAGPPDLKCMVCDREFTSEKTLRAHLYTHDTPKSICLLCGKVFRNNAALKLHSVVHSNIKSHQCNLCFKSFSYAHSLKIHLLTHVNSREYACKLCSQTFNQKQHLNSHLLVHTGEKPHKCNYCGVAFAQKGNLVVHMRKHTMEKPYVCNVCYKGFRDSSQLKKHRCTHETVVKVELAYEGEIVKREGDVEYSTTEQLEHGLPLFYSS